MGLSEHVPVVVAGGCAVVVAVRRRWAAVGVAAVVIGALLGGAARGRAESVMSSPVPSGGVEVLAVAITDPMQRGSELAAVIRPVAVRTAGDWTTWDGPLLLLEDPPGDVAAGESLQADGSIDARGFQFRGRPVAGVLRPRRTIRLGAAANPVLAVGNSIRRHVLGTLDNARASPPGALLAGFLIGDVSRLPASDNEALRSAGLSHFVAVSGSNVALFLAAWWLVGGPLGLGPRRRAVFGLLGLVVFAVVTRWEPSVVRASVMAGLVLAGRWFGRPVAPWTALGGAVALSLLVAPELAGSAGFGLSVAATAGIIAGVPVWSHRRPRWVWATLGATMSAQVAVAPLLLLWFGSVPLMAPAANLVAAPIVSAATALGGIGAVVGVDPLIDAGAALASVVLGVAHVAADLPQLGPVQVGVGGVAAALAVKVGWLRPPLLVVVVALVAASVVPARPPAVPTAYFLDVGQGDSTVFVGPTGETILVDGGPDPAILRDRLDRLGIGRIDLLVVTHRHADHATGLQALQDHVAVGAVWHAPQLGEGGAFDEVIAGLADRGAEVSVPDPGDRVRIGAFDVEVLGPLRRYAGPNDGSIVLRVTALGRSVIMTGDIEVPAQADLGPLPGDVMKVPHQGAATSDAEWLAESAPGVAVISVGPNDYGHPSDDVIRVLEEAGAVVLRTDIDGTVVLPLDDVLAAAARLASHT